MMKVCIVSPYSYYFLTGGKVGRVGGAELDLYLVGKYLAKDENFLVSFVVADFGQKKIEFCDGIKILRSFKLKRSPLNYFMVPLNIFMALKKADSDVYICAAAGLETGITYLFCKIFGKKFIYRTAHDMDCNKDYVKRNPIVGRIYEYGLLRASEIFTSVRIHGEILHKTYQNKIKKIIFVPYGLEPNKDLLKEKEYILWVARGEKWKNPQLFLDLVESFPEQKFLMIMPKKAEETDFFEEIKTKALNLDNLTFSDGVPFEKIQPYFDRAKIFINTSEYEGFTFTLLQSGVASTPVLYYKVNPDGIISEHQLGYWANGDMDKMKAYLDRLIKNKNDWEEKSKNIKNYILAEHNIEKNIQIWKDILNRI